MDAGRGNRGLLLDVVNRGNPVAMRSFDLSPAGRMPEEEGSGWPLQRGYTVLTCGWQHNVPGGTERFALSAPEALINGKPISGKIRYLWQLDSPADVIDVTHETSGAAHTGYPVLDVKDPEAVLVERDYPLGPARTIPRDHWRFEPNRTSIRYSAGFEPGKTYEVVFTAEGAPVTGIGFAALRDAVSFLRFGPREAGNPCAGSLDWALAFGTSQTGRLLRHVLYEGFVEDEEGRLAVDGVLANVAGPLRTEANVRFGQPSFIGADSPGFGFPFTDATQTDPLTGQTDGLLAKLAARGKRPKVIYTNTSAEYANLTMALIHLTADQRADAEVPDNVRIYQMAGTHHPGGNLPLDNRVFQAIGAYWMNSMDYRPIMRAALRNLEAWVTEGTPPPASRYPRLSDGTLIPRSELRKRLAHLAGPGMAPQRMYPVVRLDWGSRPGYMDRVPPMVGEQYADWVTAVDDDGNEIAGIRPPDLAVPLATYTGWNPRHPSVGGSEVNFLLNGSTIPFGREKILARYGTKDAFLAQVRAAAEALIAGGYYLVEDLQAVLDLSSRRWDAFTTMDSPLP
ncbi:MAG: hypothetical protein JO247_03680 [Chloroflexi bacterium]|nr:hypothetical protein [Chloroflexota bacterium]